MVSRLEADRRRHALAIAEIDRVLEQVGRVVGAVVGGGGAPVAEAGPRLELTFPGRVAAGKRGRFSMTGEQSVLEFIRREGRPSTADVNAHWRREGRRGTANVILLRLLKMGMIAREADASVRGSRYVALGEKGAEAVDAGAVSCVR